MRLTLRYALSFVLAAATALPTSEMRPQQVPSPDLPPLRTNSLRALIGTGVSWAFDGDGLRLSRVQSDRATDSLIATLGYNVVRIPGGLLARTFDWTASVGPNRAQGRDYEFRFQPVLTGLAEFKAFAARNALRVMYTLNMSDPPARAAELFAQWRRLPPLDGPDISYVELGNEEYIESGSAAYARRYSELSIPVVRAVRRAAPRARIGAVLYGPRMDDWDTVVVNRLGPLVDYVIWHRYAPYLPYVGASGYTRTLDVVAQLEPELQHKLAIVGARRLPIVISEYNLTFKADGQFQNVELLPRFYLLLGHFLYLAARYDLGGVVKHCLANQTWHTFADINFNGGTTPRLSVSGAVSRFLQTWLMRQDSIGAIDIPGTRSARVSLLIGRGADGTVSFLMQNHDSVSASIRIPALGSAATLLTSALLDEGGTLRQVAPRPNTTPAGGVFTAPPYSITVLSYRPR